MIASERVSEPVEIIVVVSGAVEFAYRELMCEFASVRWTFSAHPLWFRQAVRRGIRAARWDWVYLLNSDMVLDPEALAALLPWRARNLFGISSQIYFKDAQKRREETGWTRFRRSGGAPIEIWDALPDDTGVVRGNFYPGGGASLFRRKLLVKLIRASAAYDPFYWEDVEWGVRAWRNGWTSLFCPASRVWHEHRATNRTFFDEAEIDRIQKRNRIVYHLRNHIGDESGGQFHDLIGLLDRKTVWDLVRPDRLIRIIIGRIATSFQPFRDLPLEYVWEKYHFRPVRESVRESILVVTPYAVYPPAHGGARRIHNLVEALAEDFDIVLLSDEANAYTEASLKYFSVFASVHLTGGRPRDASSSRIERMQTHSHSKLREQLRFILASCRPSLIQIEHAELSPLAALRTNVAPWILTLHDVLLSQNERSCTEDEQELRWIRKYDAVIACSEEDAHLVPEANVSVVPNGAAVLQRKPVPSPDRPVILFAGPFRYQPNLDGIQTFLGAAYGRLQSQVPGVELWILGGDGAPERAAAQECFRQQGVRVMGYVEHPMEWLERCAVTINPLREVRGSCVKLIESIAARRVCVSTREGARGFLDASLSGLVVTETVEDFVPPLTRLLCDSEYRRSLEYISEEALARFSWEHSAAMQSDLYRQWMRKYQTGSRAGC